MEAIDIKPSVFSKSSKSSSIIVYVIIVTYNGEKWIEGCLRSIHSTVAVCKTVLIDNHSHDRTLEIARNLGIRDLELLESKENLGFGKANNLGIKHAMENDADYVFLLNQDADVLPTTIDTLVELAEAHKTFGVLTPMQLNGDGTMIDYSFSHYLPVNLVSDLYTNRENLLPLYEMSFANAAAWLIPVHCIETVGGFDPLFEHYGEDRDYIQRAHYHGFQVGICPAAVIRHDRKNDPTLIRNAVYSRKRRQSRILYHVKDVRKPYVVALFKGLQQLFADSYKLLAAGEVSRFFDALPVLFRMVIKTPQILRSRARSKSGGLTYLW